MEKPLSLDEQHREFTNRRFLAMPLAGTIVWTIVGIAGFWLAPKQAAIFLFVAVGMIAYLGMFISRFSGEKFFDKAKPKNTFDTLFFSTTAMSWLVFAIAIPFYFADVSSTPLTVGILTGLMWLPFSWIIQHWIGIFHSISRTLLIVTAWYLIPTQRFVVIPLIIVAIYLVTIAILESRWRRIGQK